MGEKFDGFFFIVMKVDLFFMWFWFCEFNLFVFELDVVFWICFFGDGRYCVVVGDFNVIIDEIFVELGFWWWVFIFVFID